MTNRDPVQALVLLANARDAIRTTGLRVGDKKFGKIAEAVADAFDHIVRFEPAERMLGLVRPNHRIRDSLTERRHFEMAVDYLALMQRDWKSDLAAVKVGRRWNRSPWLVKRIVTRHRERALRAVSDRGSVGRDFLIVDSRKALLKLAKLKKVRK